MTRCMLNITTKSGGARRRRSPYVRKTLPGGIPGGAQLDHDSQETGKFSRSVQELRVRNGGSIHKWVCRKDLAGFVHHPTSGQDRSHHQQRRPAMELIAETGSLAAFFWQFEPQKSRKFDAQRAVTEESIQMSKALKKRGWKFVGPTTCYSFMQSMGIVNDHHPACGCRDEIEALRTTFTRPPSVGS